MGSSMRFGRGVVFGVAALARPACGGGGNHGDAPIELLVGISADGGPTRLYGGDLRGRDLRLLDGGVGLVQRYAWSPDRTRVAFVANDGAGDATVYVLDLPDGVPVPVSPPPPVGGYASDPQWSPDGTHLAWVGSLVDDAMDTDELWVGSGAGIASAVSGSEHVRGTSRPFWSPDSTHLADGGQVAGMQPNGAVSLWVVGADGSGRTNVSGALVVGGSVSWNSPTGTSGRGPRQVWSSDRARVAFLTDKDTDEVRELYTVKPDGTGIVKALAAPTPTSDVGAFEGSPTAPQLLAQRAGTGAQLWVAPAAGGGALAVSGATEVLGPWNTRWNADGTRIAYVAAGGTELRTVAPDATSPRLLASLADPIPSFGLQWAPVDLQLGFAAGIEGVSDPDHFLLYTIVDVAGAAPVLLTPNVSATEGNVLESSWDGSPDATRLGFVAQPDAAHAYDLFVVNADGSGRAQLTSRPAPDGYPGGSQWTPGGARFVGSEGDPIDGDFRLRSSAADGGSRATIVDEDAIGPDGWTQNPELR